MSNVRIFIFSEKSSPIYKNKEDNYLEVGGEPLGNERGPPEDIDQLTRSNQGQIKTDEKLPRPDCTKYLATERGF